VNTRTKGGTVRIEVTKQPEGLCGGPEVWVRVLSTEVLDWPRIESKLGEEDIQAIKGKSLLRYLPHHVTEEERVDHAYSFEDWFIWGVRS